MKKSFFFLLLFVFPASLLANIFCSKYFDRSISSEILKDLSRVKSVGRLEMFANKLRAFKANTKLIERDRFYIERLLQDNDLLYSGSTHLLKQKWRVLFRETELSYHRLAFHEKLLRELPASSNMSVIEVLDGASTKFTGSFERSLLASYQESYYSLQSLEKFLKKQIRKDSKRLGNKFHEYRLTRGHIEFAMKSSHCNTYCKRKAQELLDSLGVSAREESLMTPSLVGLRRPSIEQLRAGVLNNPVAHELMAYQNILFELKAAIRDQILAPKVRRAFVNFLYRKFPAKRESVAVIDRILLNTEARINHFPLIDIAIRKGGDNFAAKLDILRSYNVSYANDALLITFARRVDRRAKDAWKDLLTHAQTSEPAFYQRMLNANKEAELLGGLSQIYRKSPARAVVSIALGFGAFKGLEVAYKKIKERIIDVRDESPIQLEEKDVEELEELTTILTEGVESFQQS